MPSMPTYLDTKDKKTCFGCSACAAVCPVKCISMRADTDGFVYPEINTGLCINCEACRAVCPIQHTVSLTSQPRKIYACQLKDLKERQHSSSGGIFFAIARWIIDNGGIVYGAAFDRSLTLRHTAAATLEELEALRGSKYIQSEIDDSVFKDIRKNLRLQRWCYFVGTGCQVAALKSFLGKDKKHPRLVTSDIVCHGVPNQQFFDTHIKYLEKANGCKVKKYQFRDNCGWGGAEIVDYENGKRTILPSYALSPYLYAFMQGFVCRESCYECPFASAQRTGDITLGDFWGGAKLFKMLDASTGISFCAVNSDTGEKVWDNINNQIVCTESDLSTALPENSNLIRPTARPAIRDSIFETIRKDGYASAAKTVFRPHNHTKLRIYYFLLRFKAVKAIYNLLRKS